MSRALVNEEGKGARWGGHDDLASMEAALDVLPTRTAPCVGLLLIVFVWASSPSWARVRGTRL